MAQALIHNRLKAIIHFLLRAVPQWQAWQVPCRRRSFSSEQSLITMDISLLFSRALLAGVALLVAAAPAGAEPGRLLASQCAQCHGTNGAGPGFDELAGKSSYDLFHDLLEMKYRRIEGIMDRQARGYTDEQLRLISDYLSTQPGTGDD